MTSTVVGVLIGTFSALGQQPAKTNVDRDLLAIEELHKKDSAAGESRFWDLDEPSQSK